MIFTGDIRYNPEVCIHAIVSIVRHTVGLHCKVYRYINKQVSSHSSNIHIDSAPYSSHGQCHATMCAKEMTLDHKHDLVPGWAVWWTEHTNLAISPDCLIFHLQWHWILGQYCTTPILPVQSPSLCGLSIQAANATGPHTDSRFGSFQLNQINGNKNLCFNKIYWQTVAIKAVWRP